MHPLALDAVDELERQLADAHRRAAATAEVLKTIDRSQFALQKGLDILTEAAVRLCGADKGFIRGEGARYVPASSYAFSHRVREWGMRPLSKRARQHRRAGGAGAQHHTYFRGAG
jgi:hypothetical protein